jgi:hypothetical protein
MINLFVFLFDEAFIYFRLRRGGPPFNTKGSKQLPQNTYSDDYTVRTRRPEDLCNF